MLKTVVTVTVTALLIGALAALGAAWLYGLYGCGDPIVGFPIVDAAPDGD